MKDVVKSHLQKFPPKFLLIVALATGFFAGFLYLYLKIVSEIFEKEMDAVDSTMYMLTHQWDSPLFRDFMVFITQTGSPFFLIFLSIPLLIWMYTQKYRVQTFLLFVTAFVGGGILNTVLKELYQRERPLIDLGIGAYGYSLPSGHAMISMIFYGAVSYLAIRTKCPNWLKILISVLSIVMILLIGMSRVYLEAHYFSDVLVGYLCGALWLAVCIVMFDGRRLYRAYEYLSSFE